MEQAINYLGNLFATNFCELGLGVTYVKGYESPLGNTYLYNLNFISQYNKKWLQSLLEKISIYHHFDLKLIDTKEAHFGIIDTTNKQQVIPLSRFIHEREITIGLDTFGNKVCLDFNRIPHLLIAGSTGSGKSVLLHNIICNLLVHYNTQGFRKGLQMVIIDPKSCELDKYMNIRNTTYIDDTYRAITNLARLETIMDDRYKNGGNYNHEIFIIIDELADLMLTSKYEVEQSLVRIAQKGRAVGMHLIVATQTPRVSVISGILKVNMEHRIGLKVASKTDSVVVLDHAGLEALKGRGDCIARLNGIETRCQIALPSTELISTLTSRLRG